MSSELADAIKSRFLIRPDVKAIQDLQGNYRPALVAGSTFKNPEYEPWSKQDILDHLAGTYSYGHYLLSKKSNCKVLSFDLDLNKSAPLPSEGVPDPWSSHEEQVEWENTFTDKSPIDEWRSRQSKVRPYLKSQMRAAVQTLCRVMHEELGLETAAAYSGHKGVHAYGFFDKPTPAADVREGGQLVMDILGGFAKHEQFPMLLTWDAYPIFTVEMFPKQDQISGDGFGNLMRLPLGKNLKAPKDPTFFIDLTAPLAEMRPTDSLRALTEGAKDPWKIQGE